MKNFLSSVSLEIEGNKAELINYQLSIGKDIPRFICDKYLPLYFFLLIPS